MSTDHNHNHETVIINSYGFQLPTYASRCDRIAFNVRGLGDTDALATPEFVSFTESAVARGDDQNPREGAASF